MTLQAQRPSGGRPRDGGPPPGYDTALVAMGIALGVVVIGFAAFLLLRDGDEADDGGFQLAEETTSSTVDDSTTAPSPTGTTAPGSSAASPTAGGTAASSTGPASSTTGTAAAGATTSASATTTPPTTSPDVVWPDPARGAGFDSPEDAARSFALDVAGFGEPIIGGFRAGDGRSGEIDVRPSPAGPATTVLVRQIGSDDSWWVVAAISGDIVVDEPTPGQAIGGVMRVAGRGRAFEGTIEVDLFLHGDDDPLVSRFVTGRGDGVLGDFDQSFALPPRVTGPGFLVLAASSADDGSAWTVTVVPVRLG